MSTNSQNAYQTNHSPDLQDNGIKGGKGEKGLGGTEFIKSMDLGTSAVVRFIKSLNATLDSHMGATSSTAPC